MPVCVSVCVSGALLRGVGLGWLRDVQGIRQSLITHFGDKCIFEILTDCSIYRCGEVETQRVKEKQRERGTDRVNLQIRD